MSFSENLKNIRAERKLLQEQLAELLGVSKQAVLGVTTKLFWVGMKQLIMQKTN